MTATPLPDPDVSTADDWYEYASDSQHTIGTFIRELDEQDGRLPYLLNMQVYGLHADANRTMQAIDDLNKHSADPRIAALLRDLSIDLAHIAAHVEAAMDWATYIQ